MKQQTKSLGRGVLDVAGQLRRVHVLVADEPTITTPERSASREPSEAVDPCEVCHRPAVTVAPWPCTRDTAVCVRLAERAQTPVQARGTGGQTEPSPAPVADDDRTPAPATVTLPAKPADELAPRRSAARRSA